MHSLVLDPISARNHKVRFVLINLNIFSAFTHNVNGFLAGPSVG